MKGFESYTKFKTNVKDSRAIYDITFHLYQAETIKLGKELKGGVAVDSAHTTVATSTGHSAPALYQRLQQSYPNKLRQLLFLSTITALEVYLTDVILEIFERDLSPFKVSEPVTFQKNYLLSTSSINTIHSDLITKDFTNLKIGGIKEIEQYYKKMFEIDIKNLSVSFKEIEEIHLRRHLFVHKTGVADLEYVTKFPGMGYKLGQQIKIEHDYLIASLERLSEFALVLNKALLKKFPETNRKPNYNVGSKYFDKDSLNLMLEISILTEGFDIVSYLTTLTVNGHSLSDYIVQVTTLDNSCVLFLSGKQSELSVFFSPLKQHKSLLLNKTIEVMR